MGYFSWTLCLAGSLLLCIFQESLAHTHTKKIIIHVPQKVKHVIHKHVKEVVIKEKGHPTTISHSHNQDEHMPHHTSNNFHEEDGFEEDDMENGYKSWTGFEHISGGNTHSGEDIHSEGSHHKEIYNFKDNIYGTSNHGVPPPEFPEQAGDFLYDTHSYGEPAIKKPSYYHHLHHPSEMAFRKKPKRSHGSRHKIIVRNPKPSINNIPVKVFKTMHKINSDGRKPVYKSIKPHHYQIQPSHSHTHPYIKHHPTKGMLGDMDMFDGGSSSDTFTSSNFGNFDSGQIMNEGALKDHLKDHLKIYETKGLQDFKHFKETPQIPKYNFKNIKPKIPISKIPPNVSFKGFPKHKLTSHNNEHNFGNFPKNEYYKGLKTHPTFHKEQSQSLSLNHGVHLPSKDNNLHPGIISHNMPSSGHYSHSGIISNNLPTKDNYIHQPAISHNAPSHDHYSHSEINSNIVFNKEKEINSNSHIIEGIHKPEYTPHIFTSNHEDKNTGSFKPPDVVNKFLESNVKNPVYQESFSIDEINKPNENFNKQHFEHYGLHGELNVGSGHTHLNGETHGLQNSNPYSNSGHFHSPENFHESPNKNIPITEVNSPSHTAHGAFEGNNQHYSESYSNFSPNSQLHSSVINSHFSQNDQSFNSFKDAESISAQLPSSHSHTIQHNGQSGPTSYTSFNNGETVLESTSHEVSKEHGFSVASGSLKPQTGYSFHSNNNPNYEVKEESKDSFKFSIPKSNTFSGFFDFPSQLNTTQTTESPFLGHDNNVGSFAEPLGPSTPTFGSPGFTMSSSFHGDMQNFKSNNFPYG